MYGRRDASLVLMDASGFGVQFPAELLLQRLATHECYSISAKFVVLVDVPTGMTRLDDLFGRLGIVNYLVVPLHADSESATVPRVGHLYTMNQFSRLQYRFDMSEHSSSTVGRYFPDKLRDVHGYRFYMVGHFVFPYVIDLQRDDRVAGLMVEALQHLIVRKLNGTMSWQPSTAVPSGRAEFDVTFDLTNFREHFMHDFTLMERGGTCLLCPFRTERDFMSHLLKPFSIGIWLVLGLVYAVCRLLGRLFPGQFRGNLIGMVFFGNAVPYRLPFPTRVASFAVAVLVFFLSEAYNAKIISLMSLAKYYERPETVQEFTRSELLIANPDVRLELLADQLPGKVLSMKRANQIYRERGPRMYNEYCTVSQCHVAMLAASDVHGERGYRQYVMREHIIQRLLTLQLATHSPFHGTFVEYLLHYFESGIWMFRVEGLRNELAQMIEVMIAQFTWVVFHFDDLICIWVLIMVGWLLSLGCFCGELFHNSLSKRWALRVAKGKNRAT